MTYITPETSSQSSPTKTFTDSSTVPIVIVGSGLAGMVAAYEALQGGKQVVILDQENRNNLGGQAFWSLGGLFYVGSPEQKLMRVSDSYELAWRDWENSAVSMSCRRSAGQSAVAATPAAMAIPFHDSTSPGAPARKWCGFSANHSNGQKQPDNSPGASATAWKACYKTSPAESPVSVEWN